MATKKKRQPKEDPRITALGRTVKTELARELKRRPIAAADFDSLVEYLDYVDHARYSHDELASMLDALVAEGLATNDGKRWSWRR